MKWKREKPGVYTAGPYLVEQHAHGWYASGPGLDESATRKDEAQHAAEKSAWARLIDISDGLTTEPVVGDIVIVGERRGQISSKMAGAAVHAEPLYCIRFVRGKRLCLFRREFVVAMP